MRIIVVLMLLIPSMLLSQDKGPAAAKKSMDSSVVPVLSQYSNRFKVKDIYFNRKIDLGGRGEILEAEIIIENLMDDPIDFYLFTVASYEVKEKTSSSFERPVPGKDRIRSFVVFPDDISNFQYPVRDAKGNIKKDYFGKDIIDYKKHPHDSKKGINPSTGKLYHLKDKLVIRTYHLSKYRNNYFFFNEAALLIFDKDGKPAFRQLFRLKGWRR